MSKIELPEPIILPEKYKNKICYKDAIYFVYNKYMKNEFFDIDKRPKLKNKFIFVDTREKNLIEGLPERYWHITTFRDDMEYSIDPCLDLNDRIFCKNQKDACSINLTVPQQNYNLENRTECIYRLRRVNRIVPIIKMANYGDERVKIWRKKPKQRNKKDKVFLRFQESIYDHIIILLDWGNMYKFVTAYPVSHRLTKKDFDKNYREFKENK